MNESFKHEMAECQGEINYRKQNLVDSGGQLDVSTVKGFDLETFDDSIDVLDIYSQFLGEEEYFKMKDNYLRALNIMTELN